MTSMGQDNAKEELGYTEYPPDRYGVKEIVTTGQLRVLVMPRNQGALKKVAEKQFKSVDFPGLYILFEKGRVYVGEAGDLVARIRTHMANPDDKIKGWELCLLIHNGRPSSQSLLNDGVVRKALESYLIDLFKLNKFKVISQGQRPSLNASQEHTVRALINEINLLLMKMGYVTKVPEPVGQEEITGDEIEKILKKKFKEVNLKAYEGTIDGSPVFVRPGSKKSKGWQVTFRDRFLEALKQGEGYLLFPRGGIFLVPLSGARRVVTDQEAYKQNTIDFFIEFGEDKVLLKYKKNSVDISGYNITRDK